MFILTLVTKDFEGTWIENIFVSKNKQNLMSRIKEEKEKYIQKQIDLFEDNSYKERLNSLFDIGELESFINDKLYIARQNYIKEKYYVLDDKKFEIFNELKAHLFTKSKPLAISLNIDDELIKLIIDNRHCQSLKFSIKEIEEI